MQSAIFIFIVLNRVAFVMAKKSATELYNHYYMALVYSLPIKDVDFMDELLKHDLLPGGVKSKLESLTVNYERSTYFLDNVIKPGLAVGSFDSLLTVMKCNKHDTVKDLAMKIETELTVNVKCKTAICICIVIICYNRFIQATLEGLIQYCYSQSR